MSRLAVYLTAGNALGDRVSRRRLELLMVIEAIETKTKILSASRHSVRQPTRAGERANARHTSVLILEEQVSRLVETTGDITHDGAGTRIRSQREKGSGQALSQSAIDRMRCGRMVR